MKYCRHSGHGTFGRLCAMTIYPFTALVCFSTSLYLLYGLLSIGQNSILGLLPIPLVGLSVACLMGKLTVSCYRMESRRFSITSTGIVLCTKKKQAFYAWDQVYEVAIVAYAANASLTIYDTVICCFLEPQPTNFLKKILRSYYYGAKHTNSFVIIDYSCSIHDAIASSYPGDIHDYRKEQLGLWK